MSCGTVKKFKSLLGHLAQKVCGDRRNIEKRLRRLEEKVRDLERKEPECPLVIEQLYVEKIEVDKVELNNNIGAMGIKELSGMLNIGANYGGGIPPQGVKGQGDDPPPPGPGVEKRPKPGKELKCNISYKETKQRKVL